MSIKNIVKGLFRGQIPGYVKTSVANKMVRDERNILEDDIWDELSHTDLKSVGLAMLNRLNRLYFTARFINFEDPNDIIKIRDKLINDLKKLEGE